MEKLLKVEHKLEPKQCKCSLGIVCQRANQAEFHQEKQHFWQSPEA